MVVLKRCLVLIGRHAGSLSAILVLLFVCTASGTSRAGVTCTAAGPALNFGAVNPYSGFPYATSGSISYSCSADSSGQGSGGGTVYMCLSIGTGSGGTTPTNRTLASGMNKLMILITGGASSPGNIGNGTSYAMVGPIVFAISNNSTVTGSIALALTMPAPGTPPPPGTYTSGFSGTDAQLIYAYRASSTSCAALASGTHSTTQANFSVSAAVPTQCTISATSLAFPTVFLLTNPVNATATISATCNASTPVTVALDNGATGTGPMARQMKSGLNAITYGIYRDASATLPWGSTAGTNTAALSTGTGTLTAYGRVPSQASPVPGAYTDVVNVIITY